MESPAYTSLLYLYGKYVIKTMANEIRQIRAKTKLGQSTFNEQVDSGYLGSGIGALEECTRTCIQERQPHIQLLIGQAYRLLNMPLKTYEHWLLAQESMFTGCINQGKKKKLDMFLDEYLFFTRIRGVADNEVDKVLKTGKKCSTQNNNTLLMITASLKQV